MLHKLGSVATRVWLAALLVLVLAVPGAAQPGDITLASTSDEGVKGNDASLDPSLPAEGTKVAFHSYATNLDPIDRDGYRDVYVKDLLTGDITLVSTSDAGVKGEGESLSPTLSADGTKVAFWSVAPNLDAADGDYIPDVYVKDLRTGDITLASTSDVGLKGNGDSSFPSFSADGTKVAFNSRATNLDPADTDGVADIFVKDLLTGDVALASSTGVGIKGNADSLFPSLSADGTTVAFETEARNLHPADTDFFKDIYVKDLSAGDLTLASTSDEGVKGNDHSIFPSTSGDGSKVAFQSWATNLDQADTDFFVYDIYVKELSTGDLVLASISELGVKGNDASEEPFLLADGDQVAFQSWARNLDPADTDAFPDVYLKNLSTGGLALASTSDEGVKGNGFSQVPALSGDGTKLAFWSTATNLDPDDRDSVSDIYAKELGAGDLIAASGHAHTDYSGDGKAGPGDVHVTADVIDAKGLPTGRVGYRDRRLDPPGKLDHPFTCSGLPEAMVSVGANSVQIEGGVRCRRIQGAIRFSLILTDNGPNPPAQDTYHLVLYDGAARIIYDWSDPTTVGLGDLLVEGS